MKKILKKIGRTAVLLTPQVNHGIHQYIVLVDGNYSMPNNLVSIIKDVKERFKNAKITVLTFKDKEEFVRDNFSDIEVIIPDKIKIKKFQLAIKLFSLLLHRDFKFIILSSLDISPLSVSLIFGRCPIFLHNRWFEWYRIRYKTIADIFHRVNSVDRKRRRTNSSIKEFLKSSGRMFVILTTVEEEDTKSSILIEDNGYSEISHISTAARKALEAFINPDITVLTFPWRKEHFVNMFPQSKIVIIDKINRRHAIAMKMYKMRKSRFSYIILTTLDISPIIVSLLFTKSKVLLYNRWHQWWGLPFKGILDYLKNIAHFLIAIPLFIYLSIVSGFILARTNLRLYLRKYI